MQFLAWGRIIVDLLCNCYCNIDNPGLWGDGEWALGPWTANRRTLVKFWCLCLMDLPKQENLQCTVFLWRDRSKVAGTFENSHREHPGPSAIMASESPVTIAVELCRIVCCYVKINDDWNALHWIELIQCLNDFLFILTAEDDAEEDEEDLLREDVEKGYEYELIGVTVHTGTADGGHYYSFIRDRLNKNEHGQDRW